MVTRLFFYSDIVFGVNPLIYIGWTIEYEVLFYVVFGLSLYLKNIKQSLIMTSMMLIILIFGFNVNSIMLEFIIGIVLGLFYKEFLAFNILYPGLSIVTGTIGLVTLGLSIFIPHEHISRVVVWGIPAFFIVWSALTMKPIKESVLTKLGDASYSIYLIQILTIPSFYKVASKLNLHDFADVLTIVCLIWTTVAGYLFYLLVETKISKKLRQIVTRRTSLNLKILFGGNAPGFDPSFESPRRVASDVGPSEGFARQKRKKI